MHKWVNFGCLLTNEAEHVFCKGEASHVSFIKFQLERAISYDGKGIQPNFTTPSDIWFLLQNDGITVDQGEIKELSGGGLGEFY